MADEDAAHGARNICAVEFGGHFDESDVGLLEGFAFDGVALQRRPLVVAGALVFDGDHGAPGTVDDDEIDPLAVDGSVCQLLGFLVQGLDGAQHFAEASLCHHPETAIDLAGDALEQQQHRVLAFVQQGLGLPRHRLDETHLLGGVAEASIGDGGGAARPAAPARAEVAAQQQAHRDGDDAGGDDARRIQAAERILDRGAGKTVGHGLG